jgi:hypothetical protein
MQVSREVTKKTQASVSKACRESYRGLLQGIWSSKVVGSRVYLGLRED